jgi:hypothetical protein
MNSKDAAYIEYLFVGSVGLPIALMGAAGVFRFLRKEDSGAFI